MSNLSAGGGDNIPEAPSGLVSWQKPAGQLDDEKGGRARHTSWKNFCKVTPTKENSAAVQDELDCVTTCYICDETYRDPMILPCIHTFCLTCLQRIGNHTDKNPGDSMPCPFCSEEFTIPEDGFAGLKKNFFMATLIEITTAKEGTSGVCEKHEHQNIFLYCSECNEFLCSVCLHESHQNHRLSDLSNAVNVIRSQLQCNLSTAKQCISDALKKKERLLHQKISTLEKIQNVESEVLQIRNDLKAIIDRHADSLLQDLDVLRKEQAEHIEIEERELSRHLDCLKTFELHCAKLASNNRHSGLLCKMASELKEQVVELKRTNKSIVERQLSSFEIQFAKTEPTLLEIHKMKNTIGVVKANIDYKGKPELVTEIRTSDTAKDVPHGMSRITGMAVSDSKIIIVNYKNPVVSIFDSNTFKRKTQMTLKGFVREIDLKHCVSVAENVYIVNGLTKEILRIGQDRDFTKWSTMNDYCRLSVSDDSTIVATCFETGALREYSLHGTLQREFKLCSTIVHPLHAIKLGNGHFVVSHGSFKDTVHRVCMVNNVGVITKTFGGQLGSSVQQVSGPMCLAADKNENILVLDRNNSRVLLFSPSLEFKRELLTKANGLRRPAAMHLDNITRRLYIADNNFEYNPKSDSKIFVFNLK